MTLDYEEHHCKRCGKYYELAWINGGYCNDCFKFQKLKEIRESIKEGEPDTFSSDYVVCPYCGAAISDEDLIDYPDLYEEGEHELECGDCGKKFKADTMISYHWETHKMENE